MKNELVIIVICILVFYSCNKNNKIEKAEWLMGTWENITPQGNLYEKWSKISNDELSGISYVLDNNDTIIFEEMRLVQENDTIFYIVTVKNHNNNLSVSFPLKSISESEMLFENKDHDFPQVILYQKISADSLVAEISGEINGEKKNHIFPMKKID